jgi:hypothetical protein
MEVVVEIVKTFQDAKIPTILVAGGLVFIFFAIGGGIVIPGQTGGLNRRSAGLLGALFLLLGLVLSIPVSLPSSEPPAIPTSTTRPNSSNPAITDTPFPTQTPTISSPTQSTPTETSGELSSCPSFQNNETRSATPGMFVLGDITINGVDQFTDNIGEGTVAYFEMNAEVFAKWGAGCLQGNKILIDQVVQDELEHGCDGSGCTSVRFVLVQTDAQQVVQYYYKDQDAISSTSSCPVTPGHLGAGKGFPVTVQKGCHYHFNVACPGCSANVENNFIIYYAGESGDTILVTVPEGSVWRYDRVPTTGEVCEAQDFYPTELPPFLSQAGIQLLNICN